MVATVLVTVGPHTNALEIDPRSACNSLLSADPVTTAFLRLAFPGVYGSTSLKERDALQKVIDNHQFEFHSLATPEIRTRRSALLTGPPIVSIGAAKLQADVLSGEPIDKMIFATHALDSDLERKMAEAFASDANLKSVPSMVLASEDFPMRTTDLLKQTSLFQYSVGGRLSPAPLVRTAYLTGGFAYACLARTVRDLIWKAFSAGLPEIKIVLISDLIYSESYGEGLRSTNAKILNEPWSYPPDLIGEYLRTWMLDEKEYQGDRALKLYVHEGQSKITDEKIWEGDLSPIGHPEFKIHLVIDAR